MISNTKEYRAWIDIKLRCLNPERINYLWYGERGITVCDRWKDSFKNFLEDVGLSPSAKHSIDRIKVNGNYEPGNCRWSTHKEQCNNTRRNIVVAYDGRTQTLKQWCEELGLKYNVTFLRIKRYGFSIEQAFVTPKRNYTWKS